MLLYIYVTCYVGPVVLVADITSYGGRMVISILPLVLVPAFRLLFANEHVRHYGALAFSNGTFRVTEPYITRMRDTMAHRGPDGADTWVDAETRRSRSPASLDHRSVGVRQPADVERGRHALDHLQRRDLQPPRAASRTGANRPAPLEDRPFRHRGDPSRLRGVGHRLSVAISAACSRSPSGTRVPAQLWLVRDRIGIKPLYYSVHHGRLTFASEIKALLKDPEQRRAIDETALFHYLSFLTTPGPETLFDGIKKLAPGTWIRVGADGTITERRYWDVWDDVPAMTDADEDDIAERVLAELRTAVSLRKVSDVPVGVFLSGGIDSSTNAALFSEGEASPVKTFSIGYADAYRSYENELTYARQMAARVGADHHEYLIRVSDIVDFLPRMVQLQDEPIGDPVCVPLYYVAKLARDNGVVVCQLGEGADELFIGYPSWLEALKRQHWNDWPVPNADQTLGCAALAVGRLRPHRPSRMAASRLARRSRCSGAAPRPSRTSRSGACCRRDCAARSAISRRGKRSGRFASGSTRGRPNRRI